MGGVADTVSGVLGTDGGGGGILGVVDSVTSPVIKSVGSIADGAVRAVGSAAESVGQTLQSIGQGAIDDPIGTIAKVAAVSSGQWWALPLVSAGLVVANGGDISQAALAAGVSLAAAYVGGQISNYLNAPALDSAASQISQDAASLAAQNIPASQIADILAQSYPEIATNVTSSLANAAAAGISSSTLASAYAGAFGSTLGGVQDAFSERLLSTAVGNSAVNFAKTLVQTGGDVTKALTAGAAAGIGTQFSGMVSNELIQNGANSTLANITGKIAGATAAGVTQGQDIDKALGTALVSNIVSISYAQAGAAIKTAADESGITKIFTDMGTAAATKMNEFASLFQSSQEKAKTLAEQQSGVVNEYNTKLNAAADYYQNKLTPAQQEAQRLQGIATDSFNAYAPIRDQFSSLVTQYDAAKAANNFDLANSLADQANALIPSLNAATDQYNGNVNLYQSAAQSFNDIAATYTAQTNALEPLKAQYTNLQGQITTTTEESNKYSNLFNTEAKTIQEQIEQVIDDKTAADEQLAQEPTAVKQAFQNAFSTGMMPTEAAEVANNVSKLSGVSQDAFNQSFATGESVDNALKFAQNVNGLSTKDQNYYDFASGLGLKPTDALSVAPQLSSSSTPALQSFFDTYSSTGSTTQAAEVATNINSLSKSEQTAFVNGRMNGLDINQSLQMAQSVGGLGAAQQETYLDAVKFGLTDQYAAMYAKSAGIYTADKTALADVNEQNLNQLQNQEAKDAYAMAMAKSGGGSDPTAALNAAKQLDQEISTNSNIYISGVGQNPTAGNVTVEGAGITTTPEEKGFFEKYGSLFSFGTGDESAPKSSIFGTGASGGNASDPFGLIAFDTQSKKDQTMQTLDVILNDTTKTPEEKQIAEQIKQKVETQPIKAPTQAGQPGQSGTGTSTSTTATVPTTSDQVLQNYIDDLVKSSASSGTTAGGSTTGSTATTGATGTTGGGTTAGGTTDPTTGGATTGTTGAPNASDQATAYANAALQKAIATGDQKVVDAVTGGNTSVISALNAGNNTLAASIAAGAAQTTGAVNQLGTDLTKAFNDALIKNGNDVTKSINDLATQFGTTASDMQSKLTSELGNLSTQVGQGTQATTQAISDSTKALQFAMATGDANIVNAVKSGNTDVIAALNSGNSTLAAQIATGTQATVGAIGASTDAINKAMATGDQKIVDAVKNGNTDVINALNSGNSSLASQIAAGTSATQAGTAATTQAISDSTKALQYAMTVGDQRIVDAVKSGNTGVIDALNSGNANLASQIAAGTSATTGAISASTDALTKAMATGDANVIAAVKSGNTDVVNAINSGNTNLAKTIADTSAATQAGISGIGTQLGEGFGTIGTQLGAGFGTIGDAIAAQSAAQAAAAKSAAANTQRRQAVSYMQGAGSGSDTTGGIKNLTAGLTQGNQDYSLAGIPTTQESMNPTYQLPQFAVGGSTTAYDPLSAGSSGDSVSNGIYNSLKPGLTKAQIQYILSGLPGNLVDRKAAGGAIEGHNPQFFSEGGLGSIENTYVRGEGDGTSDSVAAMLADGEFVIPADVVSSLGNGSNEAGASVLDQFLKSIRTHKQGNGEKLPPDSKGPLAYLIDANRKAKA